MQIHGIDEVNCSFESHLCASRLKMVQICEWRGQEKSADVKGTGYSSFSPSASLHYLTVFLRKLTSVGYIP